jgi:hypothetical protein
LGAAELGQAEEHCAIVGLLHDFDYKRWPNPPDHCSVSLPTTACVAGHGPKEGNTGCGTKRNGCRA